jgi:hypothetical protein
VEDGICGCNEPCFNQAFIAQEFDIDCLRGGAINGDKVQGQGAPCALEAEEVKGVRHGFSFLQRWMGYSFFQ